MVYQEQESTEPGSVNITFKGPCDKGCAFTMVTNPAETQMIGALGVKIGGKPLPEEYSAGAALDKVDNTVPERHTAADLTDGTTIQWSEDAIKRMNRIPSFIRGMVRISYEKHAKDQGISLITPEFMDQARVALGMQGM